ncbi:MAG: YraN family protein [Bdellovibrionales bacterium]|nr:YraN family protein [Bdellovibrionales bacterium]
MKCLQQKGHIILYHRLPTWIIEVDIVSLSQKTTISIVEVKSSKPKHFYESLQMKKLLRLQNCLLEQELDVELLVCYPNAGKMQIDKIET